MQQSTAIAVEIGGSVLRLGLVDRDGRIIRSARNESAALRDQTTASKVLLDYIRQFLGDQPIEDFAGIGIAMAGLVDNEARSMVLASNLGWRDFHMGDEIEATTGMTVIVDKDTNMSAIGELYAGAGRDLNSFIYAALGTGAGGAVIYDRRLVRGIGNRGGEFGHLYSCGDALCGCGSRGCLETIAGGAHISRRAREAVADGRSPKMLGLAGDVDAITPRTVVQAAEQGDDPALGILSDAAHAVGIGLLNSVRMIYPEAVILGGSVGSVREFIFDPVKEYVERMSVLPGTNLPPVKVLPAGLGDSAALIGAGLSVFQDVNV
jgi:glucokinase